jgi:sugar phosphate isomerase/epimerase
MTTEPFESTERLSLNQYTTHAWSVREAVDGCARAGLRFIGLWRDKVAAEGLKESSRICRDHGVSVSGLCRGGMFPAATAAERKARIADTCRAIDECSELESDTLVLVCGGPHSRDIQAARRMVEDGVGASAQHAAAQGVRLGIEPLHPMFAGDRSVICQLGYALDIVERIGMPNVGVVIDVYHVWWDPGLYRQIERARGKIFGFHVNDWIVPSPDILMGRGMMGDGIIELRRIRGAIQAAGYDGPIECEIFNREIWEKPGDEVLSLMKERFLQFC